MFTYVKSFIWNVVIPDRLMKFMAWLYMKLYDSFFYENLQVWQTNAGLRHLTQLLHVCWLLFYLFVAFACLKQFFINMVYSGSLIIYVLSGLWFLILVMDNGVHGLGWAKEYPGADLTLEAHAPIWFKPDRGLKCLA